ncbi:MAG: isocitrate lyase/PEP mutase family protein [Chloroflexi bacterium]|nr:isocitrate lyase/PEP mutase family protein [Chloroflexota bacterium]
MRPTTKLQELFNRKGRVIIGAVVGCALDARIIEMTGYEVAHISGAMTAATVYGLPDAGLITATEMIDNARRIASCVKIPVICDADQGFGNAINVRRTVQEFIRAGVAGIHIEDQPFPKRCGFVKGKQIISFEEAVGKYKAAVDAKNELDPDFVIIARCDARGTVGGSVEEVIRRLRAYKEVGVDVVYPEALLSREEIRQVRAAVDGPMFCTLGFIQPPATPDELVSLGLSLWPEFGMIQARVQAYWEFANDFKVRGTQAHDAWEKHAWNHPVPHTFDLVGFPEVAEAEEKYLPVEWLAKYEGSRGLYEPRKDKRTEPQKPF